MKALARYPRPRTGGFTIVEISLAMTVAMFIASGVLMLLGLHSSFMTHMNEFRFLRDEAPQINSLVAQIVEKSVSYRIHANSADAFGEAGPVNTGGRAVRLMFRNPSGLMDQSVIAFEMVAGEGRLNYYRRQSGAWPALPDWTITSGILDAQFSDDSGVLLMSLVGPENEAITYAGTTQ